MSVSYGFYNSINHDRVYDATQFSSLFDGLILDGVYETQGNKFQVKYVSKDTVTVDTGRAWFNHTWTFNDQLELLTIEPPELPVLSRIDAVIIEVNESESVRENTIKIIKGTQSSTPVKPTLINNETLHQYPLAYMTIPPAEKEDTFSQSSITNAVGTSECPYVTGLIQTRTIDQITTQWETLFNEWNDAKHREFDTWFAGLQESLSGDVAANLNRLITEVDYKTKRFYNVAISWAVNPELETKDDYGYRGTITCLGITENYSADVRLPYKAVSEGWIASVTNTGIDKVYIYSNTSSTDMGPWTVPVIICDKIT